MYLFSRSTANFAIGGPQSESESVSHSDSDSRFRCQVPWHSSRNIFKVRVHHTRSPETHTCRFERNNNVYVYMSDVDI